MAKGDWTIDLANGRMAENRVGAILTNGGFEVACGPNTYVYDLAVMVPNHRQHLLEVKDESGKWRDSGNVCIEICSGQDEHPSGMYTTEANIQVHLFGNTALLFKTQPMRNFLHDKLHEHTYRVIKFRNGDSNVQGILVPRADLKDKPWAEEMAVEVLPQSKLWRN